MVYKKNMFYILSLTWGLPLTLIGLIVASILIIFGKKPKKFGLVWCFTVSKFWGGISFGLIILTDERDSLYTKQHEFGHGIQNCVYGFLMPFIVCIPSVIRYWYRDIHYDKKGIKAPTEYNSIWFEKQATNLGITFYQKMEENNNQNNNSL